MITNGVPIHRPSIRMQLEDSPLAKDYKYSNTHHSTTLMNVTYDSVDTKNGVKSLSKRMSLINTHIPKLQDDNVSFVLRGSRYIPMIYLTDQPMSFKKKSISFESLFCTIVVDLSANRAIILESFVELDDLLRVFLSDKEIETWTGQDITSKSKHQSMVDLSNALRFVNTPITNLATKLNNLFFDDWTAKLFQQVYGLDPSLRDVFLYAASQWTTGVKPGFVDLNEKRLQFIEILLKPIFRQVTSCVRKVNNGYAQPVYTIMNNNSCIVKWFANDLDNAI